MKNAVCAGVAAAVLISSAAIAAPLPANVSGVNNSTGTFEQVAMKRMKMKKKKMMRGRMMNSGGMQGGMGGQGMQGGMGGQMGEPMKGGTNSPAQGGGR